MPEDHPPSLEAGHATRDPGPRRSRFDLPADQAGPERRSGGPRTSLRETPQTATTVGQRPASKWARDLADTDDLVQETLLQTFKRIGEFEPRRSGRCRRICDRPSSTVFAMNCGAKRDNRT